MSAKFTPGPWTYEDCGVYSNDATGSIVARVSGRGLEFVPRTEIESEANGRLIAAAPQMYEALQDAEGALSLLMYETNAQAHEAASGDTSYSDALRKIRFVLAKAEGK